METNTVNRGAVHVSEILGSMDSFKKGVNNMLLQRRYFIDHVLPILQPEKDFYIIKGRRILSKGGAERLANIYGLVATFERDTETLLSFSDLKNLVAFRCVLRRPEGSLSGEGRGSALLSKNENDPNKTIKMATKSAYVDAVIRSTGLSSWFSQDLEDLGGPVQTEETALTEPLATDRQKSYLNQLIRDNIQDEEGQEQALNALQTATKHEASEMIASFVGVK